MVRSSPQLAQRAQPQPVQPQPVQPQPAQPQPVQQSNQQIEKLVRQRLAIIHHNIGEATGKATVGPDAPQIVAVTKGRSLEWVQAAQSCGLGDFGENYAQDLIGKQDQIKKQNLLYLPQVPETNKPAPNKPGTKATDIVSTTQAPAPNKPDPNTSAEKIPDLRWHFVGQLQSNKVASLSTHVSLWQSVDRLKVASQIARFAPGAAILIQVRVVSDTARAGVDAKSTPKLVQQCQELGLDVRGLMCVAPPVFEAGRLAGRAITQDNTGNPGNNESLTAGAFLQVRQLCDKLELPICSMGMSNDYVLALKCGSNMLRLGRTLFEPGSALL